MPVHEERSAGIEEVEGRLNEADELEPASVIPSAIDD
jgi:hypothetical protein